MSFWGGRGQDVCNSTITGLSDFLLIYSHIDKRLSWEANVLRAWKKKKITTLQNMCSPTGPLRLPTQTPLATMMCCLSPNWFIVYTLKMDATGSCEMLRPIY